MFQAFVHMYKFPVVPSVEQLHTNSHYFRYKTSLSRDHLIILCSTKIISMIL